MKMKKNQIIAMICTVAVIAACVISGSAFLAVREKDVIVSGPGVTEIKMLSDYFPKLKDTPGDTEVYVMKGEKEGASGADSRRNARQRDVLAHDGSAFY